MIHGFPHPEANMCVIPSMLNWIYQVNLHKTSPTLCPYKTERSSLVHCYEEILDTPKLQVAPFQAPSVSSNGVHAIYLSCDDSCGHPSKAYKGLQVFPEERQQLIDGFSKKRAKEYLGSLHDLSWKPFYGENERISQANLTKDFSDQDCATCAVTHVVK